MTLVHVSFDLMDINPKSRIMSNKIAKYMGYFLLVFIWVPSPSRAQSTSYKWQNHCQMGVSVGTGQVGIYRYDGSSVDEGTLSGLITADYRFGYFFSESLMIETGISSLRGGLRFRLADSLRDFRLTRAAIPVRLGYYFRGEEAFSPYAKLGAYWIASGSATPLEGFQGNSFGLANSVGFSAAFGIRYRPASAWSYHFSVETFQNLGPTDVQPLGVSFEFGLGYVIP